MFHVLTALLLILFLGSLGNQVSAAEPAEDILTQNSLLANYSEKAEIEKLAQEILDMANSFETDSFSAGQEDVDFYGAYCVYVDASVIENQPKDTQELDNLLSQANLVWNIPVYSGEDTVVVEVSKALELSEIDQTQLTEDEIEEAKAKAGQWQVVASTLYKGMNAPEQNVRESLRLERRTDCEVTLIGGEAEIRSLIAVITEGDKISGVASLQRDISYPVDDKANEVVLRQNELYSLGEFAEASARLQAQADKIPDSTGGGSFDDSGSNVKAMSYPKLGIAIVFVGVVGVLILKSIKRRR